MSGWSCLARSPERPGDLVAARRRVDAQHGVEIGADRRSAGTATNATAAGSVVLQRDGVRGDVHLRDVVVAGHRAGLAVRTSPAAPGRTPGTAPRSAASSPRRTAGTASRSGGKESGSKWTSPRGIRASSRARSRRSGDVSGRCRRGQTEMSANAVAYRTPHSRPACSAIDVRNSRAFGADVGQVPSVGLEGRDPQLELARHVDEMRRAEPPAINANRTPDHGSEPGASVNTHRLAASRTASSTARPTWRWSAMLKFAPPQVSWWLSVITTSGRCRRIAQRKVAAQAATRTRSTPSRWSRNSTASTPTIAALARSSASRIRAHSTGSRSSMPASPRVTSRYAHVLAPRGPVRDRRGRAVFHVVGVGDDRQRALPVLGNRFQGHDRAGSGDMNAIGIGQPARLVPQRRDPTPGLRRVLDPCRAGRRAAARRPSRSATVGERPKKRSPVAGDRADQLDDDLARTEERLRACRCPARARAATSSPRSAYVSDGPIGIVGEHDEVVEQQRAVRVHGRLDRRRVAERPARDPALADAGLHAHVPEPAATVGVDRESGRSPRVRVAGDVETDQRRRGVRSLIDQLGQLVELRQHAIARSARAAATRPLRYRSTRSTRACPRREPCRTGRCASSRVATAFLARTARGRRSRRARPRRRSGSSRRRTRPRARTASGPAHRR